MAQRSRSTFQKLEKERARQQKRREKDARREEVKQQKANEEPGVYDGEDRDIAGIKPGPQPLADQFNYVADNK